MIKRRVNWLFVLITTLSDCEQLSPEMQQFRETPDTVGGVEAVAANEASAN